MFADAFSTLAWSVVLLLGMTAALAAGLPSVLDWRDRKRRQRFVVDVTATDLERSIGEQLHADLGQARVAKVS
ncbi:MAG: hypothetical protein ABF271_00045 [Abyssibacter sp.]|uniref:hypothetical protein n=1 Tax=Abyssibacter sp. TaxID=2320200 RepID=UPI00321C0145